MLAQDLGLFLEEHQRTLQGSAVPPEFQALSVSILRSWPEAGQTTLAHKLIHSQHFSDGILWASLGLGPNVSDLLDKWGSLLAMPATEIAHFQEEALG
jgi:hypothetical protein